MNKFIASLLFVSMAFLTGCQNIPTEVAGDISGKTKTEDQADGYEISADYALTPEAADYLTGADSFDTIAESTPYYMGKNRPPVPGLTEFYDLRERKVKEAIKLSDDLYAKINDFNEQFLAFHTGFLNYIYLAGALEKDLIVSFANDAIDQVTTGIAATEGLKQTYGALQAAGAKIGGAGAGIGAGSGGDAAGGAGKNAFALSYIEYLKSLVIKRLYAVSMQSAGFTLMNARQLSNILISKGTNEKTKGLAEKMDAIFETVSKLSDRTDAVNKTLMSLSLAQAQITTGDYYMNLAALDYINRELPALKKKISELKEGAGLSKNGVDTIKDMAGIYESAGKTLSEIVNATDKNGLVKVKGAAVGLRDEAGARGEKSILMAIADGLIPAARAGLGDNLYNAYTAVSETTSAVISNGVEFGGKMLDNSYTAAQMGIKYGKLTVGFAVEGTSAILKAPIRVYAGWEQGLPMSDIGEIQRDDFYEVGQHLFDGVSGAKQLRQGEELMKSLEKGGKVIGEKAVDLGAELTEKTADALSDYFVAEPLSENGVLKTGGRSAKWLIKKAGGITGMATVGLFTGFAKGVYQLANPTSTAMENAEGALSVGLSFVGTSAAVLKPSQVVEMGKETTKQYLNRGFTYLKEVNSGAASKGLEKMAAYSKYLTGAESGLTKSMVELAENANATTVALKEAGTVIEKGIETYLRTEPLTLIKQNLAGVPTEFSEFVLKNYGSGLTGYLGAAKAGLGKNIPDFFDNLFASKMDSAIMETFKMATGVKVTEDEEDAGDATAVVPAGGIATGGTNGTTVGGAPATGVAKVPNGGAAATVAEKPVVISGETAPDVNNDFVENLKLEGEYYEGSIKKFGKKEKVPMSGIRENGKVYFKVDDQTDYLPGNDAIIQINLEGNVDVNGIISNGKISGKAHDVQNNAARDVYSGTFSGKITGSQIALKMEMDEHSEMALGANRSFISIGTDHYSLEATLNLK